MMVLVPNAKCRCTEGQIPLHYQPVLHSCYRNVVAQSLTKTYMQVDRWMRPRHAFLSIPSSTSHHRVRLDDVSQGVTCNMGDTTRPHWHMVARCLRGKRVFDICDNACLS